MNSEDLRVYHEVLRLLKKGQGKEIIDTLGLSEQQIEKMMQTTITDVNAPPSEEPEPKEERKHGYHLITHNTEYDSCDFDVYFFEDTDEGKSQLKKKIEQVENDFGGNCYLFYGENVPYTAEREVVKEIKID